MLAEMLVTPADTPVARPDELIVRWAALGAEGPEARVQKFIDVCGSNLREFARAFPKPFQEVPCA
jgi:hypothetical protein